MIACQHADMALGILNILIPILLALGVLLVFLALVRLTVELIKEFRGDPPTRRKK